MKDSVLLKPLSLETSAPLTYLKFLLIFAAGLLGPLGFAPFHIPGCIILSLAVLFSEIINAPKKQAMLLGFIFGLGFFGLGVSWVLISIHDYGQINYFFAGFITLAFIAYLSLFPALVCFSYRFLNPGRLSPLQAMLLFSTLWCLSEYLRSYLLTGFPWLLIGSTQIDTPLRYLAPLIGTYGLSLGCSLAGTLLVFLFRSKQNKRMLYLVLFLVLLTGPTLLKNIQWSETQNESLSFGAIQANLSMRDKWDETLFQKLLDHYEKAADTLYGKQLIILPESAIPLPAQYVTDYLDSLNQKALKSNSSILLGILQATNDSGQFFYNSLITLGHAKGQHLKRHLVPFGEYMPHPFTTVNRWLGLPDLNLAPGAKNQRLIRIFNHPIASLICYEIAYPNLLREQMPQAQWIVSISDNGWFGHSLASYQQLQMAQLLSLMTARYQVLVNNDGLSSVINAAGEVIDGLPAFSPGILQSEIFPVKGCTPWILWGDYPVGIFCSLYLFYILILRLNRRRQQVPVADNLKRGYP